MSFHERPKVFGEKCLCHDIGRSASTAAILALGLRPCTSANDPKRTFKPCLLAGLALETWYWDLLIDEFTITVNLSLVIWENVIAAVLSKDCYCSLLLANHKKCPAKFHA